MTRETAPRLIPQQVITHYLKQAHHKAMLKDVNPQFNAEGRALKFFIQPWADYVEAEAARADSEPFMLVMGLMRAFASLLGTQVINSCEEKHQKQAMAGIAEGFTALMTDEELATNEKLTLKKEEQDVEPGHA